MQQNGRGNGMHCVLPTLILYSNQLVNFRYNTCRHYHSELNVNVQNSVHTTYILEFDICREHQAGSIHMISFQ